MGPVWRRPLKMSCLTGPRLLQPKRRKKSRAKSKDRRTRVGCCFQWSTVTVSATVGPPAPRWQVILAATFRQMLWGELVRSEPAALWNKNLRGAGGNPRSGTGIFGFSGSDPALSEGVGKRHEQLARARSTLGRARTLLRLMGRMPMLLKTRLWHTLSYVVGLHQSLSKASMMLQVLVGIRAPVMQKKANSPEAQVSANFFAAQGL